MGRCVAAALHLHTVLPRIVRHCSAQQGAARLFFSWMLRCVRRLSGDAAAPVSGPGLAGQTTQLHDFATTWLRHDPIGDVLQRAPAAGGAAPAAAGAGEQRLQDPLRLEPHAAAALGVVLPDVELVDDAPGLVYVSVAAHRVCCAVCAWIVDGCVMMIASCSV